MAAETVRIEIPIETVDETAEGINSATQGLKKLEQAYKGAASSARQSQQTVSRFDRQAQKTERSLRGWAKEKYQVMLEAKERISPVLRTVGNGLRSFASRTWNVTMKAVDLVTTPVRGIIRLLSNPIFQVGTVLGVSVGLADTVNTYKDFESAMSQVRAISGATESQLEQLTTKAKEMGATTKFTAQESAEAFNYMAMAGWKTEDMLGGIEGILNLAAASGADLGTTSDIVTDALTAFKMEAGDAGHFADVLAAAASNANTDVNMMGETFKYAGAMAGTLGYSIEDVALMTGLMANSGIKASMSGTALNMIFTRLSTNAGNARDQLEDLGISFFDTHGNARDLSDVMEELRTATAGMNDEQKASVANTIAGTQSQKGLLAILNASEKDYKKLKESIEDADGAAAQMSDTMMDNLAGSITLFQSALDGVKISFGERLSPYIRGIADWLTDQMPALEAGLDEMMDWIDEKIAKIRTKFGEITKTDEWQNAGFFGKGKILWDQFITEPFAEWWNGTGKQKVSDIAGQIGEDIGMAFNVGIMALLGFDISDTADAGASVGASFAKGFSEGFDFDAIKSKLWDGIGNLFKSAGKLLPGGQSADLGSLLSLALLAKIGSPLLSVGKGAASVGKGLFGANEALGGASLAGMVMGSAGAGTGLLGFGANTAINLGAGNLAGGASLSAGALSTLGLGAVAGGVAGGASAISGLADWQHAIKSDDVEEHNAYTKSGAFKLGGVAAGAAAGAAIGSVVPVLGTAAGALLGAGIGGIGVWIAGNKTKKDYEAQVQAAKEAAAAAERLDEIHAKTGVDISKATFESKRLRDAIDNTAVSADQFAQMFKGEVAKNITERFGDMKLSAKEIQEMAQRMIIGKKAEQLEKFSKASEDTAQALGSVQEAANDLDKLNWKAGLGLKLTREEKEEYKAGVADMINSTSKYIENQHFEVQSALNLLGVRDQNGGIKSGLDKAYADIQAELDAAGNNLQAQVNLSLKDGKIDADEEKIIAGAQEKIAEISNRIAEAQSAAGFEAISFKFASGDLSAESFDSLLAEMQAQADTAATAYQEALTQAFAAHELGGLSDEQLEAAKKSYSNQMDSLQQAISDYPTEALAEAYGLKAEDIKSALEQGISGGIEWDSESIGEMLGLEGMADEAKAALATQMESLADAMPEGVKENLIASMQEQIPTFEEVMAEKGPISDEFYESYIAELQAGAESADFSGIGTSLSAGMESSLGDSGLYAGATAAMNTALAEALAGADYSGAGTAVGMGVGTAIQNTDMANINSAVDTLKANTDSKVNSAFGAGVSTRMPVNVTLDYNVLNPTKTFTVSGSGGTSGSATISVSAHAAGGYVSGGPQLSWLAEEGYGEFVIPTNPSRRSAALDLYEKAGQMLGVGEHSKDGFISAYNGADNNFSNRTYTNEACDYTETTEGNYATFTQAENGKVEVNLSVNPNFNIEAGSGKSEEDIVAIIRRHMKEMTDELGDSMGEILQDIFRNMPMETEA